MTERWTLSACEMAGMVRAGELSPLELVEAHVRRIEAVNPRLNAVVVPRFEAALEEARAATEALAGRARGSADGLGPLHGVPCTIKEFIGVEGLPNTSGIVARRSRRAAADATVVARLRRAGAIVLGLTNGPEGGMSAETHNQVYGRTVNPWDSTRTCGGSSGGEAAIIAAGGSPFGIGSDIAGSVRIPAALCGIAAHKPSGRLVPNTGHEPCPSGELAAFLCCGPMARRVEDLELVLDLVRGPDGRDPLTRTFATLDAGRGAADADLSGVTVFPVPTSGRVGVHPEARAAVWQVAHELERRGARLDTRLVGRVRNVFAMWSAMMLTHSVERYVEVLAEGAPEPFALGRELWRFARGRSNHTAAVFPMLLFERLGEVLPLDVRPLVRATLALRDELEATLGPRGVLLHPSWPAPAPRHNETLRTPLSVVYTALFSILEFPVTQVPVGAYSGSGLPLGLQIAAARGHDRLTLRVARHVEAVFGERAGGPGSRPAL